MKPLPLLLAVLALTGLTACVSVQKSDTTLIQPLLDKLLPPDFVGPVSATHSNQFFTVEIQGGNVRRAPDGRWTWDWLTWDRKSHFPLFSGVTWSSTGKIHLGSPPAARSLNHPPSILTSADVP